MHGQHSTAFTLTLDDVLAMGSWGAAVTMLLLFVLALTLPRGHRRKLITPAVFLTLHFALLTLRWALPDESRFIAWLSPLGVFTVLFATTRALFLFLFESPVLARVVRPMPKIFRDILQAFVYAAVLLATLRDAGVEPGSLLTTSALLTAVVGLALQNTLGNIFSGLALQAQRPFEVGDWVEFGDDLRSAGQVVEVGWRATKVHTLDEVEVVVPNGKLADMPIRNFTKPSPVARRSIVIQAASSASPDRVTRTMVESVRDVPKVLASPAPFALVTEFAESGVTYTLRYFTDDYRSALRTDSAVRQNLWYAFARAGIDIPFPRRDVLVLDASKETVAARAKSQTERRQQAISGVTVLNGLGRDIIDQLAAESSERLYAPGETVIRQGDDGDELFIVDRGEVAVLLEQPSGPPVEVTRLGPGKAFGEMSLVTGEKRTATVRAVSECELVVVGHDAFRHALTTHPELAVRISGRIATKQTELAERAKDAERESRGDLEGTTNELLGRIKAFFKL